jgi:hypothetical protein
MASAKLRNSFDACATLCKVFVAQSNMNNHSNEHQISALTGNPQRPQSKVMKDVESDKEEKVPIKGITMGIRCDHFPLCTQE